MTSYRFFLVGRNEHYTNAHVIDCVNDQDAIQTGRQFLNGVDVEIWERTRFVARLAEKSAS
jgi:hypothetical protein